MLKKTITYKDFNDVERKEDFYFNLTESELMEMELITPGGYATLLQSIVDAKDTPTLVKYFKSLILQSYGQKSPDGRRFIKSEELSKEFSETPAYTILFMELATDDKAASNFTNGIIPESLKQKSAIPFPQA